MTGAAVVEIEEGEFPCMALENKADSRAAGREKLDLEEPLWDAGEDVAREPLTAPAIAEDRVGVAPERRLDRAGRISEEELSCN